MDSGFEAVEAVEAVDAVAETDLVFEAEEVAVGLHAVCGVQWILYGRLRSFQGKWIVYNITRRSLREAHLQKDLPHLRYL